jgi:hypothetical protein
LAEAKSQYSAGAGDLTAFDPKMNGDADMTTKKESTSSEGIGMENDVIENLLELLKKDSSAKHPKYPGQSAFALKDARVVKAVRRKLEDHAALTAIHALEYDFFGGLNRIVFDFSPPQGASLEPTAILVIMDHACNVVGVVDPFDPAQPNPVLPALPAKTEQTVPVTAEEGEVPFVLARPSGSKGVPFTQVDLYMLQVRNGAFLRGLGLGDVGTVGEGDCSSPASTLSSVIIIAVPENIDEPVVITDTFNDDTCPL